MEEVAQQQQLFRVDLPKGVLDLGKCLLNDTHVLRAFQITNLSENPLRLNISTDATESLSFQLSNENLSGLPIETPLATTLQEDRFNNVRIECVDIGNF